MIGPEPTGAAARDIAFTIYQFAEWVADGKPVEAVDALIEWIGTGPRAGLHAHYVAITAPLVCMGMIRHHFPVDMAHDDLWIIERLEDGSGESTKGDVHAEVMCQVLVRCLNDEHDTAQDLLSAHLGTHGEEGLFWVGVHAVKCLAGIILAARESEKRDD